MSTASVSAARRPADLSKRDFAQKFGLVDTEEMLQRILRFLVELNNDEFRPLSSEELRALCPQSLNWTRVVVHGWLVVTAPESGMYEIPETVRRKIDERTR